MEGMKKIFVENRLKSKKVLGWMAFIAIVCSIVIEMVSLLSPFLTVLRWVFRIVASVSMMTFMSLDEQNRIEKHLTDLSKTKKMMAICSVSYLIIGAIFYFLGVVMIRLKLVYLAGFCTAMFWFVLLLGVCGCILSVYLCVRYKACEDVVIGKIVLALFCAFAYFLLPLGYGLLFGSETGDGVTKCKNCTKKEVVLFGMCEECAEDFLEWHKDLD